MTNNDENYYCKWQEVGMVCFLYKTDCNNLFNLRGQDASSNSAEYYKFQYCPYCGRKIQTIDGNLDTGL